MPTGIIPLGKRLPSPTNVHRTGADAGLDELVASIFSIFLQTQQAVDKVVGGRAEHYIV